MKAVKNTLGRMAVYYLLLAMNILPNISVIPDTFPTRNVSTIYLLALSVCLVLYYSHRVSRAGTLSVLMKALSWMSLLLILLRGVKYSAFSEVGVLARHVWYLYYVPMLLLPLFLFGISLIVSPKKDWRLPRGWYWALAVTIALIVLVLTNDWHQSVFRFAPHFADWDSNYSYGWLFYAVTAWQYVLYLAAIIILVIKCRIGSAKKHAWLLLLPVSLGSVLNILLLTGEMPSRGGANIIEFPEALIFTVVAVLEGCMQLGLIPTNSDYGKLFGKFSISAQITDEKGTQMYASSSALPLSAEQFALESGTRIGEHTLLHKMIIPGGFGFWQDDLSQLDHLNEQLAEAKEALAQEGELIRLRGELREKQTKIEQRTRVYDAIAKRTRQQSQAISRFAETARMSSDPALKEACRGRITLLGAYIKRFANLMLLSQEKNVIALGELALSVSEVLRYLNYSGIPGEFFGNAQGGVRSDAALCVFEVFENLLETNYEYLQGVFVNLSAQEEVTFKITLENLTCSLSPDSEEVLRTVGIGWETDTEDNVTYLCFILPEGGDAA